MGGAGVPGVQGVTEATSKAGACAKAGEWHWWNKNAASAAAIGILVMNCCLNGITATSKKESKKELPKHSFGLLVSGVWNKGWRETACPTRTKSAD
jgi:hypothetical protein